MFAHANLPAFDAWLTFNVRLEFAGTECRVAAPQDARSDGIAMSAGEKKFVYAEGVCNSAKNAF